jgi:hypothetical protein
LLRNCPLSLSLTLRASALGSTHIFSATPIFAHTHTHNDGCCAGPTRSEAEQKIYDKLVKELEASEVNVIDMSGLCAWLTWGKSWDCKYMFRVSFCMGELVLVGTA